MINDDSNNIYSTKKRNMTNTNSKNAYIINKNNLIQEDKKDEEHIIDKIKYTRAWINCCFCCTTRRKTLQNILLDEGMDIISEKLDIFNIFEQLYKIEINHEKDKTKQTGIIEISDNCMLRLKLLNNKFNSDFEKCKK